MLNQATRAADMPNMFDRPKIIFQVADSSRQLHLLLFTMSFNAFLASPTGPRTVHFWAPVMKWGLVLAGANEMARPVENVSAIQQLSLFATGAIWTRWSLIIKPKNYLLASVNFFLGTVSILQIARIANWRINTLGESPKEAFKYMLDMKE